MPKAVNTYVRGFDLLEANIFTEVKREMLDIGDDIATQGVKNAPIAIGFLKGNVNREADLKISKLKGSVQIRMGVVASTDYAAIQHENTSFIHPGGGKAKYLTDPLQERKGLYLRAISAAANRGLKQSRVA